MVPVQFDASKFVNRQEQLAEIIKNTPGGGTARFFQQKAHPSLAKNLSTTLASMYQKGVLTRTLNHKGVWHYFYDSSSENKVRYCRGPEEEIIQVRALSRIENLANKGKPRLVSVQDLVQTLAPYQPPLLPPPVSMKQELEHRLNEHMLRTEEVLMEPETARLPEVLPREIKVEKQVVPQEVQMVVGYKGGKEALYLTGHEAKELYLTLHKLFG